jgi:hypothetical protein
VQILGEFTFDCNFEKLVFFFLSLDYSPPPPLVTWVIRLYRLSIKMWVISQNKYLIREWRMRWPWRSPWRPWKSWEWSCADCSDYYYFLSALPSLQYAMWRRQLMRSLCSAVWCHSWHPRTPETWWWGAAGWASSVRSMTSAWVSRWLAIALYRHYFESLAGPVSPLPERTRDLRRPNSTCADIPHLNHWLS